jgi:hypothetical protein
VALTVNSYQAFCPVVLVVAILMKLAETNKGDRSKVILF